MLARSAPVDLILIDHDMPDISAQRVLAEIEAYPALAIVPVYITLSAAGDAGQRSTPGPS